MGQTVGICVSDGRTEAVADRLQAAIAQRDLAAVACLISANPSIVEAPLDTGSKQTSALGAALATRDSRVVQTILDSGVSPNQLLPTHRRVAAAQDWESSVDEYDLPALTWFESACTAEQKEMFLVLARQGGQPNAALHRCCVRGDAEMVATLLEMRGDPTREERGVLPLHCALVSAHMPLKKAAVLLGAGARVDGVPLYGKTKVPALVLMTQQRNLAACKFLLDKGADVNCCVEDLGLPTPLFYAAYWGELELVDLFLQYGADTDVRKYTGQTVIEVTQTAKEFASARKPKHIARINLPKAAVSTYDKILVRIQEHCRTPSTTAG